MTDEQTVEKVAQEIFAAMRFAAEVGAPQGLSPPNWVPGGNSEMQDVARKHARAIAAMPDTTAKARNDALRGCMDIAMLAYTGDADGRDIADEIQALIDKETPHD